MINFERERLVEKNKMKKKHKLSTALSIINHTDIMSKNQSKNNFLPTLKLDETVKFLFKGYQNWKDEI